MSQKPWYENGFVKAAAMLAGAGLIYLGQLRYERGVKAEEQHRYESSFNSAGPLRFKPIAQVDLAGKSLIERHYALERMVPWMRYLPAAENLADVREIFCLEIPAALEDISAGSNQFVVEPRNDWEFTIESKAGQRLRLYPMPTPAGSFLCLRMPYLTTLPIDNPVMNISRAGRLVDSFALKSIRGLRKRTLASPPHSPQVELELVNATPLPSPAHSPPWVSVMLLPVAAPRYRVRLTSPLPQGETAFVKLVQTDCERDHDAGDWVEFKRGKALLNSPCGMLAKQVDVEVVEGLASPMEKTVTADLGSVAVQFGQPGFLSAEEREIALTPTANLTVPKQGNILLRPPSHPKRAMLVSAYSRRDWSVAPARIPDLITHVEWLNPSPTSLGLDAIWLPWGSAHSSTPAAGPIRQGPLRPTLRVNLVTWRITRRFDEVATIK